MTSAPRRRKNHSSERQAEGAGSVPVIPYIEGDGTGRDIWRASQAVLHSAVEKAYRGKKKIAWLRGVGG